MLVREIRDIDAHHRGGTAPSIGYFQVAAAARVPTRPPPFLLGPANAEILWQIFGQIDTPPAGCYAIADAIVAPTGIAIKDGVAFCADQFIHPRHHVATVTNRVNGATVPVRDIPGPLAVICGPAHETWGHWLVDFLPRLFVLHTACYNIATLRFLLPADTRQFAASLLALCGIAPEQCIIHRHWQELIRTDLLLMPTGLRVENRLATCFDTATKWWTDRARAGAGVATAHAGPLLMLTRRGAAPERQMLNREAIEGLAREAGFAVTAPEDFSPAEQIALFGAARVIIGEYGSALHNSVFCGPGALVCGLRGTSRHPSFVQSGIATALAQDAAYVFGDTTGQDVAQRFSIDAKLFQKALEMLEAKKAVLF